jgi:hypothetical protein
MAVGEDHCSDNVNNKRKCPDNDFTKDLNLENKSKKIFQKAKICEFESNEEINKNGNNCSGFQENIIQYSNIIFESDLLPFENQIVTVENEVIHLSEINNHWCPMTVELLDLDKNQSSQVHITEIPKHSGNIKVLFLQFSSNSDQLIFFLDKFEIMFADPKNVSTLRPSNKY